jgi:chloramphenicol 3-O-phosphotransferase
VGAAATFMNGKPLVGVVGPCKSGKSTLIRGLQDAGYETRQIAQEHSFSPTMWQRISNPDVLVYLHCEYEQTVERGLNWTRGDYKAQELRLEHAREHADFVIDTSLTAPELVLKSVLTFLN